MATTTRVLDANVNGTVYTNNANGALEAIDTCHSGTSAPTDEVANGKLWLDTTTTPGILKIYNNAAWEVVHSGTVDINDGAIDGATIGSDTPAAITGTTLTATGAFTSLGIDDNGATTAVTIESSGKVGIGTSSPEEKLHVEGNLKVDFGSAGGNPRIYLDHDSATDDGNYLQLNRGDDGLEVVGQDNVKIRTNGAEAMRIDSNGWVGIGTNNPDATLTVDGQTILGDGVAESANLTNLTSGTPPQLIAGFSVPAITWSPSTSTEAVFTRDGNMQIDILAGANAFSNINFSDPDDEDVGAIQYDHSTDAMRFRTNNSERMRIDSAGRVTMPYQPAFNAKANAGTVYNTTGWNKISLGTLTNQRGSHYSTSTSRFTAPVSGWYYFSMSVVFYDGNDADGAISLAVNGLQSGNGIGVNNPSSYGNFSGRSTSGSVYLSSGDYAEVYVYLTTAMTTRADPYAGYFSGHLIG